MSSFLKLLSTPVEEKHVVLREVTRTLRERGQSDIEYRLTGALFGRFPDSAFVYDLPPGIAGFFDTGKPVPGVLFTAYRGLCSANADHQFRLWWEIDSAEVGLKGKWTRSNNGSPYTPFYHPSLWVVLSDRGTWASVASYPSGALTSADMYGRPGAGYGKRTNFMYAYPLPEEHAFTVEGQALFPSPGNDAWSALTVANSRLYAAVVNRFTAQHKYHGYLNAMYFPEIPVADLGDPVRDAVELLRCLDSYNEVSPIFRHCATADFQPLVKGLSVSAAVRAANAYRKEIDEAIDQRAGITVGPEDMPPYDVDYVEAFFNESSRVEKAFWAANLLMWCVGVVFGRWDVRMARDESLIPELPGPFERLPRVAPGGLIGPDGLPATSDRIVSEAWLRARSDVTVLPQPGNWEGQGRANAEEYPIAIAWDGVLVDDEGHPRDIVARVREVLQYVFGEHAHAVEEEALSVLRGDGRTPTTLREWFRAEKASALGKHFFDFHIQRYSKSRRKAPIYWRLISSPRGSSEYAVWLYYPRLTDDTLWNLLSEYILPKQKLEELRLAELRKQKEEAVRGAGARLEKEIEAKIQLLEELVWMESEIRAVAQRGYAPDLDDGVLISAAPLHRVIAWKEPEKIWKKLEKGEYDWAHIALKLWPERVREKCGTDKSLAIAHGI